MVVVAGGGFDMCELAFARRGWGGFGREVGEVGSVDAVEMLSMPVSCVVHDACFPTPKEFLEEE